MKVKHTIYSRRIKSHLWIIALDDTSIVLLWNEDMECHELNQLSPLKPASINEMQSYVLCTAIDRYLSWRE